MNIYDYVGMKYVALDFSGVSPGIKCILAPDADHGVLVETVREAVRKALTESCIAFEITDDGDPRHFVDVMFRSEPNIIRTQAEDKAAWNENHEALAKIFKRRREEREALSVADPDNGKSGYWNVDGVRHSAFVKATSAPEAIAKAVAAGAVGDWESPTASFVGENPDVLA